MGGDELPEDIFPQTEKCLFVGGPKHGEYLEVPRADPTFKVFAPSQPTPGLFTPLSGAYEAVTYIRREIGLQTSETSGYRRAVYVHDAVPNEQYAEQLFMQALMGAYIKEGESVDVGQDRSGGERG